MSNSGSNKENFSALDDLTGKELAGCSITRKLGQGAMGIVYLAEQKSLQRPVALKVLDPKYGRDPVYIERFEREAQASAQLVHFNLVQIYDYGHDSDIYYMVNEFVDGCTVQDIIVDEETVPVERACDIITQAARGLSEAEKTGIIHRDIKPENLMLDKGGVVKIADFGLAKPVKENSSVTQTGVIVGTPFYMSPEQARGESLTMLSDMYSLGVTFFHMVTGKQPFTGDSIISVLLQHISGERPDPTDINPAVPRIVADAILRMMSINPKERYGNFSELLTVMEGITERMKRGETGEDTAASALGIDPERLKRYKWLKRDQIMRLVRKKVPAATAAGMVAKMTTDSGVFVESDEVFPENSVVEIVFSLPGRGSNVIGLGVVRWILDQGSHTGMGITILRMQEDKADAPSPGKSVVFRREQLGPEGILAGLMTHQQSERMLRYYYANTGRRVTVNNIANALGMGTRQIEDVIAPYKTYGLAVEENKQKIIFLWPEDKKLQAVIQSWIEEHGLH